jgi:hypothetical protein
MVSNNPMALCHPLPYGRRAAPSRKDGGALEGKVNSYAAPVQEQRRDARSAGPVISVAIGPVRPSPPSPTPSQPLHRHPRRRGSVRRRDTTTPAVVPPYGLASTAPSSPHRGGPRTGDLYTATLEAVPDAYRTRHDALLEERFTRTTVYSATLYTMPLHVGEIVRHACKLTPLLAYKRRGSPLAAGEDGERSLARFPP